MITVFIRSIILYIALLISLRIMGKGEIAEMNSFDLVITFLLAEVASIPMENNNIPLLYGIASITALVLMQAFISYFALKSRKVSTLLSGKPSILINKGKIDYKELKKERISIDEIFEQLRIQGYFNINDVQYAISGKPSILINKGKIDYKELKKERISIDEIFEQLRIQGYFNINDVQYAILETDGNLSVVPSTSYEDNQFKDFKHLPIPLIIDGKIINDSLKSIKKDKKWILNLLSSYHISNYKDVLVCILDEDDKIFIQKKENLN